MNFIWFLLIFISIIIGAITGKLPDVVNAILEGAKTSIDVVLAIMGVMVFWLGIMKIAEKSGIIKVISKIIQPVAKWLFPEINSESKAIGDVALNFSANALGLANAATPIGIKAMEEFQKENINKSSASDAMCTFLAMNTAGFQLIPATVIAILAGFGAKNPTEIIVPTLIVTTFAFCSAIFIAKILKKIFPPQIKENEVEENA
ncbi:MAG: nucleoside recognition domain-containing protein [Candidatus Gastranaerophilales bacterium]|nr:nucleoside recognition domain-containing protein [Candidatus Gastranaerophilales bacterium]